VRSSLTVVFDIPLIFLVRDYLPTLIPVEVEETKAREWFRCLLSGVEFLHKRGVVHNDLK
jgi:serine/threonine protein kinase